VLPQFGALPGEELIAGLVSKVNTNATKAMAKILASTKLQAKVKVWLNGNRPHRSCVFRHKSDTICCSRLIRHPIRQRFKADVSM